MNDSELREMYSQEPWGKLIADMGWDPVNTESSARRVAEYAAKRIAQLEASQKSSHGEYKDSRSPGIKVTLGDGRVLHLHHRLTMPRWMAGVLRFEDTTGATKLIIHPDSSTIVEIPGPKEISSYIVKTIQPKK